jgi:hypothetical protein
MPTPHAENLHVPPAKLDAYLLDPGRPFGGGKAEWFARFGVKYAVLGSVETPRGRKVRLTTIWFIDTGRTVP